MSLSDSLKTFTFKMWMSLDHLPQDNLVYSPYCAFISACYSYAVSSQEIQNQLRSLLCLPKDITIEQLGNQLYEMIHKSETLPIDNESFFEFIKGSSTEKDNKFQSLRPMELRIIYNKMLKEGRNIFPELKGDDEQFFQKLIILKNNDSNQSKIKQFLKASEVELSSLQKAPTIKALNDVWYADDPSKELIKFTESIHIVPRPVTFPESAKEVINNFILDETNQYIRDIIADENISENTKLLFTNSILFSCKFDSPFQSVETRSFNKISGETKQIKFVIQRLPNALYAEVEGFKVLQLNYTETDFSVLFVLPNSLGLESVSPEKYNLFLKSLKETDVYIQIPRFDLEYGPRSIKDIIVKMGVKGLPNVSDIIQKVRFGNYEEGSIPTPDAPVHIISKPKAQFIADHPFLFFVRDRSNGTIMFAGECSNPVSLDLNTLTSDEREAQFLARIKGDKEVLPPPPPKEEPKKSVLDDPFFTESPSIEPSKNIWDELDKIGGSPQKTLPPSLNLTPAEKSVREPTVPDDSDLREFIYEGKPPIPPSKEELDNLFGSENGKYFKYPAYSPWVDVELPVITEPKYEPVTGPKYPLLPPLDIELEPTELSLELSEEVPVRLNSAGGAKPKIVIPKVPSSAFKANSGRRAP